MKYKILGDDRFLFYYDLFDINIPENIAYIVASKINLKVMRFILPVLKQLVKIEDYRFHFFMRLNQDKEYKRLKSINRKTNTISTVPFKCEKCYCVGIVDQMIPDIDNDGSLGCPDCEQVVEVRC